MCMVINKTKRHATNPANCVESFVFSYRCHTANSSKAWPMEGKTGHFLFHNGYNDQTRLRGRWHDQCIGFFDLGNGMVRCIGGIFSVDPKRGQWNTFSTTDLPKEEARALYAASRDFTWRGPVTVSHNHQFI
jgi:hypothetical protein